MTEKDKPFKHIVIIGCGDIGLRVAKIWKNLGKAIFGVVKSENSLEQLRQQHIHAISADLSMPDTLSKLTAQLTQNTLIYYFAPPPIKGTQDTSMTNFLTHFTPDSLPAHLIYISTSGVYGHQQGELVDEKTPTNPQADRAKRRYHAEEQLRQWSENTSVPITILRVGGIYGATRLPLKRIKDQIPMLHEHLAPLTNRIHEDDLAQICVAAAQEKAYGEIYNVSDGTNSNMTEYFNTIADAFDLPRPPLVDWEEAKKTISQGMLSYLKESRRMDNTKMINGLNVKLIYPSLQDSLRHIVSS